MIVLINTGSPHSFIDEKIVRKAKLSVESGQLTIQVTIGDTFLCNGYCKIVLLKMQGYEVLANLFLLTLRGCDVG